MDMEEKKNFKLSDEDLKKISGGGYAELHEYVKSIIPADRFPSADYVTHLFYEGYVEKNAESSAELTQLIIDGYLPNITFAQLAKMGKKLEE